MSAGNDLTGGPNVGPAASPEPGREEDDRSESSLAVASEQDGSNPGDWLAFFASACVGYVSLGVDGVIRAANAAAIRLLASEQGRLRGRQFVTLTAAFDRETLENMLGRVTSTGNADRIEITLLTATNTPRLVRIEASLFADDGTLRLLLTDLAPGRQSDRLLRDNREHFRMLVEGVRDYAIFMLDDVGRVACWNAGAKRIKGYDEDEIIGQHFSRFYPKEDRAIGKPAKALAIAAGEGRYEEEGWRVRKDGSRFMANVVITALRDVAGRLQGFAKVTRDITERKQTEEIVRLGALRLKTMLDNSPAAIFLKDSNGCYLEVNRRFQQAFGLSRDSILGRTDFELFAREQAEAFRAHDALVLESGSPMLFEEGADYVDGRHISIVSKFPLPDETGRAGALCGIAMDITDRKRAEEALRDANFTLQSIFDAAAVAVLTFDLQGRITRWSRGAERMFGWTAEKALGCICPTVPPDGLKDFHEMIALIAGGGSASGLIRRLQKKNGETIHASISPSLLRGADGNPAGVMVTLEDVSGRVKAQQALQDNAQRLERLSQLLIHTQEEERQRIARELHDQVGQTLTLIQLKVRSHAGANDPAGVLDLLDQLQQQIRELALGLHPTVLEDLGLTAALRWQADRIARAGNVRVTFRSKVSSQRFSAEVEMTCFRILQESLTNVLRHARARNVSISLLRRRETLYLRVKDDGDGFDIRQIRSDKWDGPSLGLVTMEERMRLAGGSLEIDSMPGTGTTVTARFPLPMRARGPQ